MSALLRLRPECPLCHAHHPHRFTKSDLSQLLDRGELTLYCPRLDMSWPAPPEQYKRLARRIDREHALPAAFQRSRARATAGARQISLIDPYSL